MTSMSPSPTSRGPTSASAAERQAEQLRRDLTGTLGQIAENLQPGNLAVEAAAAARDSTPDWLRRYWAFARSPAGLAVIGGALALAATGTMALRRRPGRRRM